MRLVLGCGMMGREHISYLKLFAGVTVSYLCDICEESVQKALEMVPYAVVVSEDELDQNKRGTIMDEDDF